MSTRSRDPSIVSNSKRLIAHPFFSLTIASSTVAWVIALISQSVVTARVGHSVVGVLWFAIILQLCNNAALLYGALYDSIMPLRLHISIFAAMSVVLAVVGIDANIFSGTPSRDVLAASWVFLSVIDMLWIIFLTSENPSLLLSFFRTNLFSPETANRIQDQGVTVEAKLSTEGDFLVNSRDHWHDEDLPLDPPNQFQVTPATPTSDAQSDFTVGPNHTSESLRLNNSSKPSRLRPTSKPSELTNDHRSSNSRLTAPTSVATPGSSAASTVYSYMQKALALYDYTGDPDDEEELSFRKGEILEVSRSQDKKWWPARKDNGRVGVVPSNYLQIIR